MTSLEIPTPQINFRTNFVQLSIQVSLVVFLCCEFKLYSTLYIGIDDLNFKT